MTEHGIHRWFRRPFPWSWEARLEKEFYEQAMTSLNLDEHFPPEDFAYQFEGILGGGRRERVYIRALVRAEKRAAIDREQLWVDGNDRDEQPAACVACGRRLPVKEGAAAC